MSAKKQTKNTKQPVKNDWSGKLEQIMNEVEKTVKKAKNSYQELDPKTRKKIAAGIAGLGALLAGTALIKKKRK